MQRYAWTTVEVDLDEGVGVAGRTGRRGGMRGTRAGVLVGGGLVVRPCLPAAARPAGAAPEAGAAPTRSTSSWSTTRRWSTCRS